MGIRIHKAMGWAVTPEVFAQHTRLDPKDGYESLYDLLRDAQRADPEQFIMPDDFRHQHWSIFKNLLDTRFNPHHEEPIVGNANDLWSSISGPDDIHMYMFWPNLYYQNKWYRYDDDMDYADQMWRGGPHKSFRDGAEAKDEFWWSRFNPYPMTNNLMDPVTGEDREWPGGPEAYNTDLYAPRVPWELRWWLEKFEVMDQEGILKLRPLLATWWG